MTTYLGDTHPKKRRRTSYSLVYLVSALALILFAGFVLYQQFGFGFLLSPEEVREPLSVSLAQSSFDPGEEIVGELGLVLLSGELVPIGSEIVASFSGVESSVSLSEVVDLESEIFEGDFYLEDVGVFGFGEGYGLIGEREIFEDVSFQLGIFSAEEPEGNASDSGDGLVGGGGGSGAESGDGVSIDPGVEPEEEIVDTDGEVVEEGQEVVEETVEEDGVVDGRGVSEEGSVGGETGEESVPEDSGAEGGEEESGSSDTSGEESGGADSGDSGDGGEDSSDSGESSGGDSGEDGGSSDSGSDSGGGSGSSDGGGDSGGDGGGESGGESGGEGPALSPEEFIIDGVVNGGENFEYELGEGESAEIVLGSVFVNGESLDEGVLDLEIVGGMVVVSTDYSEIEEGFGEEYLGLERLEIDIDLSVFNFSAGNESDSLEVSLVYEGADLLSLTEEVFVGEEPENETVVGNDSVSDLIVVERNVTNESVQIMLGERVIVTREFSTAGAVPVVVNLPDEAVIISSEIVGERASIIEEIVEAGAELEIAEEVAENPLLSPSNDVTVNPGETVLVTFELPPVGIISETETSFGKRVTVGSQVEDSAYKNILAFTEIPNSFANVEESAIRIYWENENVFVPLDRVENGLVYWTVPHLSDQTFLIILISRAEHLDSNREFISDIFESVFELDGNFSETIFDGEYVRIVFERALDATRDITIYPRIVNGTPRVEVYEVNGTELIAEFVVLNENEYNKVILTGLEGVQDTFDLKIVNGDVEFDHIIDPLDGAPDIDFGAGTPANGSVQANTDIFVDLTTSDLSDHYSLVDFGSDLVLWLRMDSALGTNVVVDSSSWSTNGTVSGSATLNDSDSVFGNATLFDRAGLGSSGFVSVDSGAIDNLEEMTLSVWLKPRQGTQADIAGNRNVSIAMKDSDADVRRSWRLILDPVAGLIYFDPLTGGSVPAAFSFFDEWQHVVVAANSSTVRTYWNGFLDNQVSGTFDLGQTTVYDLAIGSGIVGNACSAGCGYNGSMDDFIIFNRSLTEPEILALYNSSANSYARNFTNLQTGEHRFRAYAVDSLGQVNQTEERVVSVGSGGGNNVAPEIEFVSPTTQSQTQLNDDVYVNVSSNSSGDHYAFVDFGDSLVTWLRFDEVNASGGVIDLSSAGNDGQLGSAIVNETGYWGNASHFDGVGDRVVIPHDPSLDFTNAVSFSVWVRPNFDEGETNFHSVYDKRATGGGVESFRVLYVGSGVFRFRLINSGGTALNVDTAAKSWNQGDWIHLAGSYNGTNATIYFDGLADSSGILAGPLDTNNVDVWLGMPSANNGIDWDGAIDEFMLFDRPLDSLEIASLYNASANQYENNFTNLNPGVYDFSAHAVDVFGNRNQTETRTVTVLSTFDMISPDVVFVDPTPLHASKQLGTSIFVNLSSSDANDHYSFADFDSDLVLWLRMDDVSGNLVTDLSSFGNDGTLLGNAVNESEGYWGDAVRFDGDRDVVSVADSDELDFVGEWTLSTWVFYESDSAAQAILTKEDGPTASGEPLFIILPSDLLRFTMLNVGAQVQSTNVVPDGAWSHLVVRKNASNYYTMFFNGTIEAEAQGVSPTAGTSSFRIGSHRPDISDGRDFKGLIDEFMLFNRSLSDGEVLSLYNSSANQYERNFTNLDLGFHDFTGYAVDSAGNLNMTENRIVEVTNVDTVAPDINFTSPTPANGSTVRDHNIFVNLSTGDIDEHYAFVDFGDSLVVWYRLDNDFFVGENSNFIYDWSGNGFNGTPVDDAIPTVSGRFGGGYQFDQNILSGNVDYIEINDDDDELDILEEVTEFTLSIWARSFNTNIADHEMLFSVNSGGKLLELRREDDVDEGAELRVSNGTEQAIINTVSGSVTNTNWHHWVVDYNGTDLSLYIDNALEGRVPLTGKLISGGTDSYRIGTRTTTDDFWEGQVDEFMIFNRSISREGIASLFNVGVNKYEMNFTNLPNGNYTFTGYAVDVFGNMNSTEERVVEVNDRVPVVGCRELNVSGRVYTLQQNVLSASGTCFNVTADNVALDGQGFTIDGDGQSGSYGVYANGVSNFDVVDLTVQDFERGVFFDGDVNDSLVVNNTIRFQRNRGVHLIRSSRNVLSGNVVSSNNLGIAVPEAGIWFELQSRDNVILDNVIQNDDGIGIVVDGNSDGAVIENNILNNNDDEGMFIHNSANVIVRNNSIIDSLTDSGISVFQGASQNISIIENKIFNSAFSGIAFADSINGGRVAHNYLEGNSVGIQLFGNVDNILIENNTINSSVNEGIDLVDAASSGNVLLNNLFVNNSGSIDDSTGSSALNYLIYNNSFGEVRWIDDSLGGFLRNLSVDADIGYGVNLNITDNFVDLNVSAFSGLINSSANVTLFGVGERGFNDPVVHRNRFFVCDETTSPSCSNFTALNDSIVAFNVSSFSTYSVGNDVFVPIFSCPFNLDVSNRLYLLQQDIVTTQTCFNVTADNITLDGFGYSITGDSDASDDGVFVHSDVENVVIRNLSVNDFGSGVEIIDGTVNYSVVDGSFDGNVDDGIFIRSGVSGFVGGNNISGSPHSILIQNTTGTVFDDNYFSGGSFGIRFAGGSKFNRVVNSHFVGSSSEALRFAVNSSHNVVLDSNISVSSGVAVSSVAESVNNTLLNVTYDSLSETVNTDGEIIRKWHYRARATNLTGGNVSGVNITAFNVSGDWQFNFTTDVNGLIPRTEVTDYVHDNSGRIYYSNYSIFVINDTFTPITRELNVTFERNVFDVFVLDTNQAPVVNSVTIFTASGNNRTDEDLTCRGDISDANSDDSFIETRWYLNGVENYSQISSTTVTPGIYLIDCQTGVSFDRCVTDKGENWTCGMQACDDPWGACGNWLNSTNLTVLNSPPEITLLSSPANNADIADVSPTFSWVSYDADNDASFNDVTPKDALSYELNITCHHEIGGGCVVTDDSFFFGLSGNSFDYPGELQNFNDAGDDMYYNWSVRGFDGEGDGLWFSPRSRFNVLSLVSINLTNDLVNFSSLAPGNSESTEDDSPLPFMLENIGNVFVNVTVNASDLWLSSGFENPTLNYLFRVDENPAELGSFDFGNSITSFTSVPDSAMLLESIVNLNHSDSTDLADVDVSITVPPSEPPGTRSSTITFIAERSI